MYVEYWYGGVLPMASCTKVFQGTVASCVFLLTHDNITSHFECSPQWNNLSVRLHIPLFLRFWTHSPCLTLLHKCSLSVASLSAIVSFLNTSKTSFKLPTKLTFPALILKHFSLSKISTVTSIIMGYHNNPLFQMDSTTSPQTSVFSPHCISHLHNSPCSPSPRTMYRMGVRTEIKGGKIVSKQRSRSPLASAQTRSLIRLILRVFRCCLMSL